MHYQKYNREERDLCAHLFRLLLEDQQNYWQPLRDFLGLRDGEEIGQPQIYCEAALLRDAYDARISSSDKIEFVEKIVSVLEEQLPFICEHLSSKKFGESKPNPEDFDDTLTPISKLPGYAPDRPAHPSKDITKLTLDGKRNNLIYPLLQSLFNAKPDLVICCSGRIYFYEAKFTQGFTNKQFALTKLNGEVWRQVLYRELGYPHPPDVETRILGLKKPTTGLVKNCECIFWDEVYGIALRYWGMNPTDFSIRAIKQRLDYQERRHQENGYTR